MISESADVFPKKYTRRIILLIFLLGIITFTSLFMDKSIFVQESNVPLLVNYAGRQRALLKEITGELLLLKESKDAHPSMQKLKNLLEDLITINGRLHDPEGELSLLSSGENLAEILSGQDRDLASLKNALSDLTRNSLTQTFSKADRDRLIQDLIKISGEYYISADHFVNSVVKLNEGTIFKKQLFDMGFHLSSMGVIFFIAFLIFIPMKKQIEKNYREMQREMEKKHIAEKRLLEAQRIAAMGFWQLNLKTGELLWSDEIFSIFNLDPKKFQPSYEAFLGTIHPEDREKVNQAYTISLEDKMPYSIEHRLLFSDGSVKWVLERCETSFDESGEPVLSVGAVMDITDRVRMEEDLELYRYMIEKTSDPVFLIDIDDNFRMAYVNEAAVKHYGASREEILTWRIPDWDPNFKYEDLPEHLRQLQTSTDGLVIESLHRRKSGELIPVEITLNYTIYKGKRCHFGYIKNIVERKKNETELLRAKEEAEAANRSKSEFLSNMSHEIRTPMNAVLGLIYLMKHSELTAKQKDYLRKIEGATQSLLGIINDILDLSRIEAGKLILENIPFDLSDVMRNLSTIASVATKDKPVEVLFQLSKNIPHNLIGDPLRMGQILINLTNNAVKFTERGTVIIKLDSEIINEGRAILKFDIHDTGIGMTEAHLQNLFRPFVQADSSTNRRFGGSGLGLSIARRLLDLMGGSIRAESKYGKGSTFYLEIPVETQKTSHRPWNMIPEELAKLKILLADDNSTALAVISDMLESFGWDVTAVDSCEKLLEEFNRRDEDDKPDLLLIDLIMQGMNGIEAVRELMKLQNSNFPFPKIFLITAHSRDDIRAEIQNLPVEDILLKPVTPSVLLESIVNSFRKDKEDSPEREINPYLGTFNGKQFLVVEDNFLNQEIFQELLIGFGAAVTLVDNGLEAIKIIFENPEFFDAVLMDVQMPEMDGLEATMRIREDEKFIKLPILALTANAMIQDQQNCLDAGMNDFIPKPVDVKELHDKLKKWIG